MKTAKKPLFIKKDFLLSALIVLGGILIAGSIAAFDFGKIFNQSWTPTPNSKIRWTEQTGLGISAPACSSASAGRPTCDANGTARVTISWTHGGQHGRCSVARASLSPGDLFSGDKACNDSHTFTGLTSNTTYAYSVSWISRRTVIDTTERAGSTKSPTSFTTPNCAPPTLSVTSSGASGVDILSSTGHGGNTGTTGYTHPVVGGTSVNLQAPATSGGNNFASWSGCTSSTNPNITITMPSSNTTCTANYVVPSTLTVTPSCSAGNPANSLSWTPVSGATSYRIEYCANLLDPNCNPTLFLANTSGTSYTDTGSRTSFPSGATKDYRRYRVIAQPVGGPSNIAGTQSKAQWDAVFVPPYQNLPTQLFAGDPFSPTIQMTNTGCATWTGGESGFVLFSRIPSPNESIWGTNRITFPGGQTVAPNATRNFTANFSAPNVSSLSTYGFTWQMRSSPSGTLFGQQTTNQNIAVAPPLISCSATPNPVARGQTAQWTLYGLGGLPYPTNTAYTINWSGHAEINGKTGNPITSNTYTSAGTYPGRATVAFNPSGPSKSLDCPLLQVGGIIQLFVATPGIINPGDRVTVRWETQGFDSCVLDANGTVLSPPSPITGSNLTSGTFDHNPGPVQNTDYTLTCTVGSFTDSITRRVNVRPPPSIIEE